MPIHIESLPGRVSKGGLLRFVLDTEELRKQQVGSIEIYGNSASIEIPDSSGPRLVKRLDGQKLSGRMVQVWFESVEEESDPSGHFARLDRWLGMERRAEAQQAAEWLSSSGEADSSTGLTNLVIRSEDTGLGGHAMVVLGRKSPMQPLPATQLRVGTPIRMVGMWDSSGSAQRGLVTRLDRHEIELALGQRPAETDQPLYRIDASDDEVAFQRSRAAMARARHARGDRISELRDICIGMKEAAFDDCGDIKFEDSRLNESQMEAIRFAASARDIAVIHGPPGTGKTRTLVELIRQTVLNGGKVLVCAPSNLGVDNLFERLLVRGTNAVRIGHVARVLPQLREQCLNALVPKHRQMRQVKKLRSEAADLFRKVDKPSRSLDRAARQEMREEARNLLADARDMEAAIAQEIMDGAEVVCATNTGITSDILGARRFDLVVIDEACQCSEPSCWIPLLRANRLVLAGDHCQLPPTVISHEAAKEGFAVSLQERLVELYGERVCRPLRVQYRMHEEIMGYSSTRFYEGGLQADESVASHRLIDLSGVQEDELTTNAVRFIDTSGSGYEEELESAGSSIGNPEEAVLAAKKASDLMKLGVMPEDIAIITPYSAQVRILEEQGLPEAIEIGSVDSFQGREKEAVIISLVRSNEGNEIGFLKDTRRMNVALTRARRKLIVIGDSTTIGAHPFYSGLLDHFDQIDAYRGVWDE